MKLTTWLKTEDGCGSFRAYINTDVSKVINRVAFIEKTPRVRTNFFWVDAAHDYINWKEGSKGEGPDDECSKQWCDEQLKLMGYKLG